tara:strand:- start:707 stop:1054 length:348 start_codon:yes stop_codon:yes gene_type:complete
MPIYIYQHPENEKYIEVIQGMNEDHVYFDESGLEWKRVFTTPNMAMDLETDPFSQNQFLEKTQNAGTMGDLWDRSAEMSAKRAEKAGGTDPYRKDYFKKYSKDRGGAKHLGDSQD